MNKKKLLVIALALCLIGTLSFTTLAWFTDEAEVENKFTIGSVEIEVVENYTEPAPMIPVVNTQNPDQDPNFVNKDAYIKNTGKNAAYVQIFVAVPEALYEVGALHVVEDNQGTGKWIKSSVYFEDTIDGVDYKIFKYIWDGELAAGDSTNYVITGMYLDSALDYNGQYYTMNGVAITEHNPNGAVKILVAGQAIQVEGFANAEAALANFGEHPWAD